MIKKFTIICLLFISVFLSGYRHIDTYVIKPEKDAFYHNNLGLSYAKERAYYAAIQEFKIAISLSPSTQSTAVFKNNLGETYLFIGYPDLARPCFEEALDCYGLNFSYYINLAKCYAQLGIAQAKIREYKHSENIYDKIKLGILYIETNNVRKGINILDDFCASEPDLMITPAVRQYIKQIIDTKL